MALSPPGLGGRLVPHAVSVPYRRFGAEAITPRRFAIDASRCVLSMRFGAAAGHEPAGLGNGHTSLTRKRLGGLDRLHQTPHTTARIAARERTVAMVLEVKALRPVSRLRDSLIQRCERRLGQGFLAAKQRL